MLCVGGIEMGWAVFAVDWFGITGSEAIALFDSVAASRVDGSINNGIPADEDCRANNDPLAVARRMRLLAKLKYGVEIPESFPPEVEDACREFHADIDTLVVA
jgi:hypothetical protein